MIPAQAKILSRRELAERFDALRARGKRIVFTNGCFDLIHVGHLRYLEAARRRGDCLAVAINSDESTARVKGPNRPILSADQRKRVLAGLACVDFVIEFDEETPNDLLRELRPDVLIKGANYSIDGVVGREIVEGYGGEVATVELTEGRSTTRLVDWVKSSERSD